MNLPEDQFSVKFYIARILLIIPYIKKNYKFLLLGALLGGGVGLTVDIIKSLEDTYDASIIFTIEAPGGGGEASGLGSLLGMTSANESSNLFATGNFEELVKMPFVYKKALVRPVKLGNVNDLFINYLIKKSNEKSINELNPSEFPRNLNPDSLTPMQNAQLNIALGYLMSKTNFTKESEKSSFRTLKVSTEDDTLSYIWANTILETFTEIYIKNKTKKTTELVNILSKRVDSLRNAYYYTQGKLAAFTDQNQQIIFQSAKITADRLQMNSSQLQGLYSEAMRNYDSYKFSLAKETPLLNIITHTELPIYKTKYNKGFYIIIGVLVGSMLSVIIIYFIKVYKEIFND